MLDSMNYVLTIGGGFFLTHSEKNNNKSNQNGFPFRIGVEKCPKIIGKKNHPKGRIPPQMLLKLSFTVIAKHPWFAKDQGMTIKNKNTSKDYQGVHGSDRNDR